MNLLRRCGSLVLEMAHGRPVESAEKGHLLSRLKFSTRESALAGCFPVMETRPSLQDKPAGFAMLIK